MADISIGDHFILAADRVLGSRNMKFLKPLKFWKKSNPPPKPVHPANLVVVSHEATRTGAPKIIAQLLDHFKQHYHLNRYTILHNPGPLYREFGTRSHVTCLNLKRQPSWKLNYQLGRFVRRLDRRKPTVVLCNSMESRFIAQALRPYQLPTIYLVHELPSSYSVADYESVYHLSEKIIFPAEIVRRSAELVAAVPENKAVLFPQGLLDETFGTRFNRPQARAEIRTELGLPSDAIVLLGCGTLDMRKGIDHFANIARLWYADPRANQRPVHFVWIGGGYAGRHSTRHFIDLDLAYSPAKGSVHFVGERESVEKYFIGGDGFLMTSRVDPFPCVIHEAMAAEIPIIAFDQAGGAAEAIRHDAGFVVPYGDYFRILELIQQLATDPMAFNAVRQAALHRVRSEYRFSDYAEKVAQLATEIVPALADCRKRPPAPATLKLPPATTPSAAPAVRRAA
jgi:glycosyltransferase involved in cell wall biosynthesis